MAISLAEFVARARGIAEGRGVDPFKSPIIDAGMTAEALVPHCIRFALTQASADDVLATTADHVIEIVDEVGALPEEVLRGHLKDGFLPDIVHSSHCDYPDFGRSKFSNMLCYWTTRNGSFYSDCALYYGVLDRVITAVTKEGGGAEVDAPAASGHFVALIHVGWRIVVLVTVDGEAIETLNALIQERISADAVNVTSYITGSNGTVIASGAANLYETQLELIRSGTCTKGGGGQIVVDQESGATDADIGRLVLIYDVDGVTVLIRAMITDAADDGTSFDIAGYTSTVVGVDPRNFDIFRIMDPTITLNTPSMPIMPDDATSDIPMTKRLADNAILILAGALTGEVSIKTLLGIEEVKEVE